MTTRVFRSIALGFIALQMLMLNLTGNHAPYSFYGTMMREQGIMWLPVLGIIAAIWLLIDVALIHLLPEFCRIGDKIRFYPLIFALGISSATMYAGKDILLVWVHYGFTSFLICACMLADAKYNNKKYCGSKGVMNAQIKN